MLARAFIADAIADLGAQAHRAATAVWGVDRGAARRRAAVRRGAPLARVPRGGRGDAADVAAPARAHLPDEFELAAETFHRFAEDKIRPVAEHVHRTNADIPEDVISGLAELGGFGLSVPEEYGGFAGRRRGRLPRHGGRHRGALVGLARRRRLAHHPARDPHPRDRRRRHRGAEAALAAAHRGRRAHGRRHGDRARLRLRRRRRHARRRRRSTAATASTA